MSESQLDQRRIEFQLQELKRHVAVAMYNIKDDKGIPRNIKWIERIAKHERMRVPIMLRPNFDRLLQAELQNHIKTLYTF